MTGRPLSLEAFRQLSLEVGTVRAVEPLLDDLVAVTVELGEPVVALAPRLSLPPEAVGHRVVVARSLWPLVIAGKSFTATLVTIGGATPVIEAEIPNGSTLA